VSAANTRAYRDGELLEAGFPVADVSEHLAHGDTLVWVDFCAPAAADLEELEAELGLHELAIEDALSPHQRPKIDHYATHRFVVCHAVRVDRDAGALQSTEIDVFVGDRWLITVRKNDGFSIDAVLKRCDRSLELARTGGVAYFLYALLDVVVDDYFDAVEQFDAYYDDVSELLFSDEPLDATKQRQWFSMRRALVHFHRLVVPTREVVSSLLRREQTMVPDALQPYYQDVYDHILRVSEATESLRDLVSTIVETNLSLRDYRQNQIVRKVGSWAAIIAVPTLITGFYGMNVKFPGFGTTGGVLVASALMVVISLLLYLEFRRREWL
jgi:magnesium transporter